MEELKGQALVGKKVRMLKNYLNIQIGTESFISRFDGKHYWMFINRIGEACLDLDEFELIPDTPQKSIHQQILEAKGFKVGDTVRVTHRVSRGDLGWNNAWVEVMKTCIGKEFIIDEIYDDDKGVALLNYPHAFPAQSLELIERKPESKTIEITGYEAVVYRDKVKVGCSSFPISDIELILETAKSL